MATLLATIQAYESGIAAFCAHTLADNAAINSYARQTYQRHMEKLDGWTRPATTIEEAVAALRLAVNPRELEQPGGITPAMVNAAIRFFEGPIDPKLTKLINKHQVAYAAFCQAVTDTDKPDAEVTAEEHARWERTGTAETRALDAIFAFRPGNQATTQAKIDYVLRWKDDIKHSFDDRLTPLLQSFGKGGEA
jgi:hypothetical protein